MALRDQVIPSGELPARLEALPGWQGDTRGIWKDYAIDYDDAVIAVAGIGNEAIELEHRPDIDVRWGRLRIFLTTHTAGDVVTELDLLMAGRLDAIVAAHKDPGI